MVISVENPVGIDVVIRKIQQKLNSELEWGDLVTIYPRCYRSVREIEEQSIRDIEYVDEKGEYVSLINADDNKCFFVQVSDIIPENEVQFSTEVELFFTVNLPEIKPNATKREDQEVQLEVLNALRKISDISIIRLIVGIENVYRGLNYNPNDDTHPKHCFKVIIKLLRFDINKKC